MPSEAVTLGPFKKGMHNSSGSGEFIADDELYDLVNLEVDTDGSLVNRPAIINVDYNLLGDKTGVRVKGAYLPSDGRRFLAVMTAGSIKIIDLGSNVVAATSNTGLANAVVVQYDNRLWVAPGPTDTAGNGGYFDASATTPTWTTVAAIPKAGAIFLHKERLWTVSGVGSTSNTSRLSWSAISNGADWPAINFTNVDAGNGEKLVYGIVQNNDIILFKQHSTYRHTYDTDPAKAVVVKVSSTIGVPDANCAVTYDNSNIYVMHDNSVYELFNYTYSRVSDNIDMSQVSDFSLYSSEIYGLSLYRDRLFVRYYTHLYVYSLKTGTWSRWESARKFSRLVVIPSESVGLDLAYASTASSDTNGAIFMFRDSRILDVGTGEAFECSVTTKTYEFGLPHAFKRLFYWGLSIATSGDTTCRAVIPNSSMNPTWDDWALKKWDDLATMMWGQESDVEYVTVVQPEKGGYARKFYKLDKSFRFVRAYFEIVTSAVPNQTSDSCVRIYDITPFIKQAQKVVERVS